MARNASGTMEITPGFTVIFTSKSPRVLRRIWIFWELANSSKASLNLRTLRFLPGRLDAQTNLKISLSDYDTSHSMLRVLEGSRPSTLPSMTSVLGRNDTSCGIFDSAMSDASSHVASSRRGKPTNAMKKPFHISSGIILLLGLSGDYVQARLWVQYSEPVTDPPTASMRFCSIGQLAFQILAGDGRRDLTSTCSGSSMFSAAVDFACKVGAAQSSRVTRARLVVAR